MGNYTCTIASSLVDEAIQQSIVYSLSLLLRVLPGESTPTAQQETPRTTQNRTHISLSDRRHKKHKERVAITKHGNIKHRGLVWSGHEMLKQRCVARPSRQECFVRSMGVSRTFRYFSQTSLGQLGDPPLQFLGQTCSVLLHFIALWCNKCYS